MDISGLTQAEVVVVIDAAALASAISRLQRGLRRRVRQRVPEPPLPQSHLDALRLLHKQPGIRVRDLAAALVLAPNSASTLAQQLIRQGYVERTVDPQDKRTAHLALSAMARRRLARWRDTRAAVLGQAIAALPEDDRAAIAGAIPALGRLSDLLEGTEP